MWLIAWKSYGPAIIHFIVTIMEIMLQTANAGAEMIGSLAVEVLVFLEMKTTFLINPLVSHCKHVVITSP